ncbi:MAG: hypothetical protein M3478_06520 [Planctomycetota bacterium]|nr:hypothetical protein [Planctomycetota bacterium]
MQPRTLFPVLSFLTVAVAAAVIGCGGASKSSPAAQQDRPGHQRSLGLRPASKAPSPAAVVAGPDAEFRAMWVATAYNLDWPSRPGLHRRVLRDEIAATIQRAKDLNCNVILLQTRAFCDRIHRDSTLRARSLAESHPYVYAEEQWAMALNRTFDPDTGNNPDFDPFAEWVDQCNDAGIELHAWINPFRTDRLIKVMLKSDETKWFYLPVIKWEEQLYLNPESKAVQDYVKTVITDFLETYRPEPDVLASAADPAAPRVAMMLAADNGPDGGVYDHQLPGPPPKGDPPPTTKGTTGPSARPRLMAPGPMADRSFAEKRTDWLLGIYEQEKPHMPDNSAKVAEFLEWSSAAFTGRGARFGVSPDEKDTQGYFKPMLRNGLVDYVIPELYATANRPAFRKALRDWLDTVPQGNDPPIIVAGLNTVRVQTPADVDDQPWDPTQIEEQMEDVRDVRSTLPPQADLKLRAMGEAHYSASALRRPDQGGHSDPADDKKNLAKRLKKGRYQGGIPAPVARRAGAHPLPDAPINLEVYTVDGVEVAEWEEGTGGGRNPKRWAVRTFTSVGGTPAFQYVGNKKKVEIGPEVIEVRVNAVDKFNRESTGHAEWKRPPP